MEPLTLIPGEYEILLAPGNRYAFISEEKGYSQTYAVLPPEKDYELPDTYNEYIDYLRTIQDESTLFEENRTSLDRIRVPMAAGTRKRKRSKRATMRRRNQRGGQNENRWTTTEPILEVTRRNAKDNQMIQNMMKGLVDVQ